MTTSAYPFPPGLFDLDSPVVAGVVAVTRGITPRPVKKWVDTTGFRKWKADPVVRRRIEAQQQQKGKKVSQRAISRACRAEWQSMGEGAKKAYEGESSPPSKPAVAPGVEGFRTFVKYGSGNLEDWESIAEAGRLPWILLERATSESDSDTELSSEEADMYVDITCDTLRPLVQHLAALRITAYFRKQNRMMRQVARASREVYREMGWGWGEKVYQEALKMELDGLGYRVTSEIPHTIHYKGRPLGDGVNVRSDILVETREAKPRQLLLELKAVATSASAMRKAVQQCSRYLYLKKYERGMVVNFPEREGDRVWAAAV